MNQNVDVQRIHEEIKIKIEPEDQKLSHEASAYSIEPPNRRRKLSQMSDDSNTLNGVSRISAAIHNSTKRRRYSDSDDESENQIW